MLVSVCVYVCVTDVFHSKHAQSISSDWEFSALVIICHWYEVTCDLVIILLFLFSLVSARLTRVKLSLLVVY